MQTEPQSGILPGAYRPPEKKGGFAFPLVILAAAVLTVLLIILPQLIPGEESLIPDRDLPDWIKADYIPIDGVSRTGEKLEALRGIVIHYVGNPGTTAKQNRSYYANEDSEVSSHFIIGLKGEVILCVPMDEKASASNQRNADTISIELCHPDESGKFNDATEESLERLLVWLCRRFDLPADSIIRHYDVTGKICPKYYVEHEDAYRDLLDRVKAALIQASLPPEQEGEL